jgi:hypothetical protein
MGASEIARKIDFMGPTFNITLNSSPKLRSMFGSFLSLTFVSALALVNFMYIKDFIIKGKPTINREDEDFNTALYANFSALNSLPIFTFFMNENAQGHEEMFPVSVAARHINGNMKIADQKGLDDQIEMFFFTTPCVKLIDGTSKYKYNYLKDFENYEELLPMLINNALCIDVDPKELWMYGDRYSNVNRRISLRLNGCVEELAAMNGEKCLSKEENVDFYLETTIRITFPRFVTNLVDHDKPIKKVLDVNNPFNIREFSLDRSDYFITYNNSIWDENQFFTDKNNFVTNYFTYETATPKIAARKSNYNFYCEYEKFKTGDCTSLARIAFWTSNKSLRFTRKYKSFMDLLGSIGGISSLLFEFFLIINFVYMLMTEKDVILNHLMPTFKTKNDESEAEKSKAKDKKEKQDKWKKLRDDANEMIKSSCDLAALLEELALLKVWTRFMFDGAQRELMVLCALQLFREDKGTKMQKLLNTKMEQQVFKSSRRLLKVNLERRAYYEISQRSKISHINSETLNCQSNNSPELPQKQATEDLNTFISKSRTIIAPQSKCMPTKNILNASKGMFRKHLSCFDNISVQSPSIITHNPADFVTANQRHLAIPQPNYGTASQNNSELVQSECPSPKSSGQNNCKTTLPTMQEADPRSLLSHHLDKFLIQKIEMLNIDYLRKQRIFKK